jgi:hypothetical protein
MKVAKIADVQNLADGSVIGEMVVTVKKVFPPRTGKNKFGKDWTSNGVILEDATGEVRATFWDVPVADLERQQITIKSSAGKKGLAGISVKYSDYSKSNELSINSSAAIFDQPGQKITQIARLESQALVQRSAPVGSVKTKSEARVQIFNTAKLYLECIKAAEWVKEQHEITLEQFQACTSSLFISADKAGLAACFYEEKPAAKSEPEPVAAPADEEDDDELKW